MQREAGTLLPKPGLLSRQQAQACSAGMVPSACCSRAAPAAAVWPSRHGRPVQPNAAASSHLHVWACRAAAHPRAHAARRQACSKRRRKPLCLVRPATGTACSAACHCLQQPPSAAPAPPTRRFCVHLSTTRQEEASHLCAAACRSEMQRAAPLLVLASQLGTQLNQSLGLTEGGGGQRSGSGAHGVGSWHARARQPATAGAALWTPSDPRLHLQGTREKPPPTAGCCASSAGETAAGEGGNGAWWRPAVSAC